MKMINTGDILETIRMVDDQNLDVRTITLSLSLLDCASSDGREAEKKVYDKIMRRAGRLVETGEKLSGELGIPIVHKRISVTPISIIGSPSGNYIGLARALDRAAKEIGVNTSSFYREGARRYIDLLKSKAR